MSTEKEACELSFADLFEKSCDTTSWVGRVVKGKVIAVANGFATVDVGLKSEGRLALSDLTSNGRPLEVSVGDTIDVYIDRYENKSGEIVLSREKALREAAWDDFEQAFKEGKTVTGIIFNRVKGGFMVDLQGTTAFLPGSHVDSKPVKDITPLMNIEQPFVILKMDKIRENIVVSRRGVLEGANAEEKAKVIAALEEGQVVSGVVKNITTYGAFVDIGGVDGLLHNVDIAWKRVNHPSEVIAVGQSLQVKIVKFNKETKRISLGLKQMTEDPWKDIEKDYPVGSKAKGIVTNVTDYGIFVKLSDSIEGLVHISEVSWKKNISPYKIAQVGDAVDVLILEIDLDKRRIGLGLKQLQANPWTALQDNFKVGDIFEGPISNVADFGLFVKINDDIDGMVHINDISWDHFKEEDLAKFNKGDVIKVKILEIDADKERVSLGIKQLTENPYGNVEIDIRKGAIVTCVISNIKEDGIETTLPNGALGFIKKPDLAKDRQDRRFDRFAVGEKVDAKIISIDKTGRRIGLSIKALEIDEEQQALAEFGSASSGASLGDILGLAFNKKD